MPQREAVQRIVGWDIGGAHVKAALFEAGRITSVTQESSPLWQGIEHLDRALQTVLQVLPSMATHAVTMTGEMTDLFAHREAGVAAIVERVCATLGADVNFFAGRDGWTGARGARTRWRRIASANWQASAQLVATELADAILVDIGSTTTDLVPVRGGRVVARGIDDATRLACGELVYHGVVRTPVYALARRIDFRGVTFNVMNELFATTADVYRLTGELDSAHDQYPAADGGDKTLEASASRLARLIGHDARGAPLEAWVSFAHAWRARQLEVIRASLDEVATSAGLGPHASIVAAGCGHFLARELAISMARGYLPFESLAPVDRRCETWARVCAPSVALAVLFAKEAPSCGS